jgi:thioredoxin-like negative regulator of GroEL
MTVYRRLDDAAKFEQTRKAHKAVNQYLDEVRALTERIRSAPDDVGVRLELARLHARNHESTDAIKEYDFLLLRAPNQTDARRERDAILKSGSLPGR